LPHPSIIRKWYSCINGNPGITLEAFKALEVKVKEEKQKGREVISAMLLDEMSIRKHIHWDGHKFQGHVDIGSGLTVDDTSPVAIEAFALRIY